MPVRRPSDPRHHPTVVERKAPVRRRAAAKDHPRIERATVSGLTVLWLPSPGPFVAGMAFRVGRADETAPTGGITHLVEHLALPAAQERGVDFNGTVTSTLTDFWAAGDPDRALDLLRGTAQRLARLPDRFETERAILLTEAASRGGSVPRFAAALRFGPRGYGLVGQPEYGLRWIGLERASAWARERFTRGNTVVWMTGEPPDALDFDLPEGERFPAPPLEPIAGMAYPAVYSFAAGGGATVSMLLPRTTPAVIASVIAAERARTALRYERGLSYAVEPYWEPLTADTHSFVLTADCREGDERELSRVLRAVLEELAEQGPTEREIEHELDERARRRADDAAATGILFKAACDELLGRELEQPGEAETDETPTPDEVAAAFRPALDGALLLTSDENWQPEGRWSLYPPYSSDRVSGRRHRPAGTRRWKKASQLVVGDDGATLVTERDDLVTVRYEDSEAVECWPDGSRVLVGRDATRLGVDPSGWRGLDGFAERVDARVPPDRLVPMNEPVARRVDELRAQIPLRPSGDLWHELAASTKHLGFGETQVDVVGAKLGETSGLLTLTARRLLFTAKGSLLVDLDLPALVSAQRRGGRWPQGDTLVVRTAEQALAFRETTPRSRLDGFVAALEQAAQAAEAPLVVQPPRSWRSLLLTHAPLVALPLSILWLIPIAALEDRESRARMVLLSVLVALVCGGTCGAGAWGGVLARRYARAAGERSFAAVAGIAVGALGVALWLLLAVLVTISEW